MGKSEIIQRLLEQGHITVAEAMTLITPDVQTVYYRNQPQFISPQDVRFPMDPPWKVTCNTNEK
jgi:hypothetical protein